jgi:transposase-like protein
VRQGRRIVSVAVTLTVDVNPDRRGEVLAMASSTSEAGPFWPELLHDRVRRRLSGAKFVISVAHADLKAATTRVVSTTWQRCLVHSQRNGSAHAAKNSRKVVWAFSAAAFARTDLTAAKAQPGHSACQMSTKLTRLALLMDVAEEDVLI